MCREIVPVIWPLFTVVEHLHLRIFKTVIFYVVHFNLVLGPAYSDASNKTQSCNYWKLAYANTFELLIFITSFQKKGIKVIFAMELQKRCNTRKMKCKHNAFIWFIQVACICILLKRTLDRLCNLSLWTTVTYRHHYNGVWKRHHHCQCCPAAYTSRIHSNIADAVMATRTVVQWNVGRIAPLPEEQNFKQICYALYCHCKYC